MMKNYEMVIGLEVHVELKTDSKIFCSCTTDFGGEANTHCCPVCMGLPGALPVLNEKVVDYGIRAGLSTNCKISRLGRQDRKHYYYPDLPTAYQISQDKYPLSYDGYLDIEVKGGNKRIGINRIHIEEDAGKLVHEKNIGTLVDYNRCGVPLIEIVSEPDFNSSEEVIAYLQKLRSIMIYIGVSDAKMNEGSFRCDVNISLRERGAKELGTRTEMKNLNSFQSITRAIEYEKQRQERELNKGGVIIQETRRFDQSTGQTLSMREKVDAEDYRYTPDPDLMPIVVTEERIRSIKNNLPELPDERKKKYMKEYGLNSYDAEQIITSKEVSNFFEEAAKETNHIKLLSNIIISEIFALVSIDSFEEPFSPKKLAELINLLEEGKVNMSISKKIIEEMYKTDKSPSEIIKEQDLEQISSKEDLEKIVEVVIGNNKKAVEEYKSGKEKALQSLIGQVMRETKGKANPQLTIQILKSKIND